MYCFEVFELKTFAKKYIIAKQLQFRREQDRRISIYKA